MSSQSVTPVQIGEYFVGRTIGRGNFAVVKVAKHRVAKTRVAIKIVDKSQLDPDNLSKIYREIRVMKELRHPNIIRLYQVMETERMLYMVTEYASKGEIFDQLKSKGRMTESSARKYFQQTVAALAYCHANSVVHRDLKAENLLLDHKFNIKLADFGFGTFYDSNSSDLLKTWCGSPPYAAPELFRGVPYDGRRSDLWSLGIILYVLVTGGFPFRGNSVEKLRSAVLRGKIDIPFYVSVECADLIRKLLKKDPNNRYSLEQVIQHRWFRMEISPETEELLIQSLTCPTPSSTQDIPMDSGYGGDVTPLDESTTSSRSHSSLVNNAAKSSETSSEDLNDVVLSFIASKGIDIGLVKEAVNGETYNEPYALYHLLVDKLKRRKGGDLDVTLRDQFGVSAGERPPLKAPSPTTVQAISPPTHQPRRGSRGSIQTGEVGDGNMVNGGSPSPNSILGIPEANSFIQSALYQSDHDILKSDSDSTVDEVPSEALSRYLGIRRHTLGVSEPGGINPLLSPHLGGGHAGLAAGAQGMLPGMSPINPLPGPPPLSGFLGMSLAVSPLMTPTSPPRPFLTPQNIYSCFPTPFGIMASPVTPGQPQQPQQLTVDVEPTRGRIYTGPSCSGGRPQIGSNLTASPGSFGSADSTQQHPEEDQYLKAYLAGRGGAKRHTIHSVPGGSQLSPTRVVGDTGATLTRQASPHYHGRTQPYNRNSGGSASSRRNSSESGKLPGVVLAHLEMIHNQALTGNAAGTDSVKKLQKEFRGLQTDLSRHNPPAQVPTTPSPICGSVPAPQPGGNLLMVPGGPEGAGIFVANPGSGHLAAPPAPPVTQPNIQITNELGGTTNAYSFVSPMTSTLDRFSRAAEEICRRGSAGPPPLAHHQQPGGGGLSSHMASTAGHSRGRDSLPANFWYPAAAVGGNYGGPQQAILCSKPYFSEKSIPVLVKEIKKVVLGYRNITCITQGEGGSREHPEHEGGIEPMLTDSLDSGIEQGGISGRNSWGEVRRLSLENGTGLKVEIGLVAAGTPKQQQQRHHSLTTTVQNGVGHVGMTMGGMDGNTSPRTGTAVATTAATEVTFRILAGNLENCQKLCSELINELPIQSS